MTPVGVHGRAMDGARRLALALAALVLLAACAAGSPTGPFAGSADGLPTLAPMLEKVLPGIVRVTVDGRISGEERALLRDPAIRRLLGLPKRPRAEEDAFQAVGSGIVIDAEKGHIVTTSHVVGQADRIAVVLGDGRRLDARLVGTDPDHDIAVIQIEAGRLVAVPIGDSDRLRVGDYVVAVGNPFGLAQTATLGIVSGLGMQDWGRNPTAFIQTDASINPGNSGGGLVNLRGELVGVNSVIIGPAGGNVGIGFAIPMAVAKRVVERLLGREGAPRRNAEGFNPG